MNPQFQTNPIKDPTFESNVLPTVNCTLNQRIDLPIDPEEISSYIKNLKINKAPGREGITNKMVKKSSPMYYYHTGYHTHSYV